MKKATQETPFTPDTRILLTGVFGPFAQDDEYGSRKDNPMELYHNQVTREQGPFSLRMFHRTFGLLMIEANIDAACTILEFAVLDRFIDELKTNHYDIIAISSILPNTGKVKKMCEEIRAHQPDAIIVVGGHIANRDDLADIVDTDHICRGDGIRWFRNFLGQDENAPIHHPAALSGFGTRMCGVTTNGSSIAAVVIPSVGCPLGCNFCSTSALFGGKGNSVVFYNTGDELFNVLCQLEKKLKVDSFFVLDENFLLYKERALRLLELMEQHDKSWAFYVFSSARVIESYSMEQLVGLGISWVWMGIEGNGSGYPKLAGVDTRQLVAKLRDNGVRVLGSTIIGLEEHTPENIERVIDYGVSHNTDFQQFMLYFPIHGTPLYKDYKEKNLICTEEECSTGDAHGQKRFNFKHAHIHDGREHDYLIKAFREDLRVNGPSLARITLTNLLGWIKYKNHPDRRIRRRFRAGILGLSSVYAASVWAMTKWYRDDPHLVALCKDILARLYAEFGLKTRIMAPVIGIYALRMIRKEDERLARGWTYEPTTIYEKNARALELDRSEAAAGKRTAKIQYPVYDLSRVTAYCHEQMETLKAGFSDRYEEAKLQLAAVYDQYVDRCKSVAVNPEHAPEHLGEIREKALGQVDRIGKEMHDLADNAQAAITGYRDTMTVKYTSARNQIAETCNHMLRSMEQMKEQVLRACMQTGRNINSAG